MVEAELRDSLYAHSSRCEVNLHVSSMAVLIGSILAKKLAASVNTGRLHQVRVAQSVCGGCFKP